MKIIFMGTPEFAVPALDILVRQGYDIVGVITAPDKPAGRGLQLSVSPVKQYAKENKLRILQPPKLKDKDFINELKSLNADLQVVVAFRMLPEAVWDMPPLGTINLHASLLPDYRGAAPINRAVINGEKFTGLTTFKLQHEIDTGNILFQQKLRIGPDETAGELHDRMMKEGAALILKTVNAIAGGNYKESPQEKISDQLLHPAPKIFKEECRINWNQPVDKVYDFIRGLSPYPTAFTKLEGKILRIFLAEKENPLPEVKAGTYLTDHKHYLKFACADGYILLKEVQLAGKKKMRIEEFLRGFRD